MVAFVFGVLVGVLARNVPEVVAWVKARVSK